MADKNTDIIQAKERLAEEVLEVAQDALQDIKVSMGEASVRDLINIFNSSIKVHRDLMSDILEIRESESKSEADLATQYTAKVDDLLKKLNDR